MILLFTLFLNFSFATTEQCKGKLVPQTTLEEFLKNPVWDGSRPFPAPAYFEMYINYELEPSTQTIPFKIERISNVRRPIRYLLRDLKKRSQSMTPRESEWAAIVIDYEDGSSEGIKLSSKNLIEVGEETWLKMFEKTQILKRGKKIVRFTHIHTHPDPRNPYTLGMKFIGPSQPDYEAYKYRKRWLRITNNPDVLFEAYVVPNCENCDDLVFVVTDEYLDRYSVSAKSNTKDP